MARYIGPTSKIARRFGEPIFGPDKALARKAYGPGQHGNQRRRGKKSEYGIQLDEKQKAKYTYGILEKQFSNLFQKALRKWPIDNEEVIVSLFDIIEGVKNNHYENYDIIIDQIEVLCIYDQIEVLDFASSRLKNDEKVVMTIVSDDGRQLQHASDRLRDHEQVAIKN